MSFQDPEHHYLYMIMVMKCFIVHNITDLSALFQMNCISAYTIENIYI